MGEVAVQYKIMPDPDIEVNVDDLMNLLQNLDESLGKVHNVEKKPLAFGLMFIELHAVIEDAEGLIDKFEAEMSSIEGVGEIEVLGMGRLL
ncbi:MAG: elongation factor 1-beta [Euryarchaeota archaeon]|nr:elongation factor 1-beta [Euryarchaeota archaeon]|tara:strand:- start:9406 stop:9678 length:273 start_codon:yes stop_codon:yes gene_type:complete